MMSSQTQKRGPCELVCLDAYGKQIVRYSAVLPSLLQECLYPYFIHTNIAGSRGEACVPLSIFFSVMQFWAKIMPNKRLAPSSVK